MELYTWNTAASAAFYGPLQAVEVGLRNAINVELCGYFRRDDWYDDPNFRVTHWIEKWVDGAKDDLTKHMSPITNDNLVAALSFGFWSGLLGTRPQKIARDAALAVSAAPSIQRTSRSDPSGRLRQRRSSSDVSQPNRSPRADLHAFTPR
jgi:hypothetical protein